MSNKQILLFALAFFLVMGSIGTTVFLTRKQQDTRSNAQTPDNSCQTPAQVQNVKITYPHCDAGNNCSLTQADCAWTAVSGVTGYQLTVIETDSNKVVKNEVVTTTTSVFNVTQNKTYQCDVAAINSCGQSGQAGTDTAVCSVDAIISSSPTPTITPTPTLPVGITPIANTTTPPPVVTLPPTGMSGGTIMIGGAAGIFILIGGALFLL